MRISGVLLCSAVAAMTAGLNSKPAEAACTFTTIGLTMSLNADCTTDTTIIVPHGMTLDGKGFAITAVDPSGDHFRGAIVRNGGLTAHVTNLLLNTDSLANVCDGAGPPDERLRGILFDGASGSITHNTVQNINQGASGCQEGNAVEVRNAPFDGTHPGTVSVEIAHNVIDAYQKTGVVCNGDADCRVVHNMIGASATQQNLAANAVQLGFGAIAIVKNNHIAGNQWLGPSDFAATAVLHFDASETIISKNNIGGNADIAIALFGGGATVDNNRVFESGQDGPHGDFGIFSFGPGNRITNNKVRGYDIPASESPPSGEITGTKVIPAPHDPGAACFLPAASAQAC